MGLEAAFWILAIVMVVGALGVVVLKNVFRAALSLVLCFLMVAGIYITLSADFLAAVQVLVYVGAISVLIILAIMLTRHVQQAGTTGKFAAPAALMAIITFGVLAYVMTSTAWNTSPAVPVTPTTEALSLRLFGDGGFIIAVEVAAVLMLTAVLGAIILVRDKND